MSSVNNKPAWYCWWLALKSHWKLFFLVGAVAVIASVATTRLMPQTYRAETWVEANPRARLDSELFQDLKNWQSGAFDSAMTQRANITELTLGFFLRSEEMRKVMREIVLSSVPDVLTRFKDELENYGATASEGLDYWIRQNLVVDRNGKDQFYRLQWFFFTRTGAEQQLEFFLERADTIWQERLQQRVDARLNALQRYEHAEPNLPILAQNELSQLKIDYQTLSNMLAGEYLSAIHRLAPVEPTQGPVFPQLGKAVIIGLLPFLVLSGLILKWLGHRVQKCS